MYIDNFPLKLTHERNHFEIRAAAILYWDTEYVTERWVYVRNDSISLTVASTDVIVSNGIYNTPNRTTEIQNRHLDNITQFVTEQQTTHSNGFLHLFSHAYSITYDILWLGFSCYNPGKTALWNSGLSLNGIFRGIWGYRAAGCVGKMTRYII